MDKKNKLHDILLTLKGKEKYVVELLYGLNNNKKMNIYEISQRLNVDERYVCFVMENIESILENYKEESNIQLNNEKSDRLFQFSKIDDSKEKLIERMSETFFNMFPNKRDVEVENCVYNLPSKDKDIVFLYYGLDGINCLDYDEIAMKYKITVEEVDEIIERSLIRLNKVLMKDNKYEKNNISNYSNAREKYNALTKKYDKEKVYNLLENLKEKERNIIKEYCETSVSYHEVAIKYNLSTSSIYFIVNSRLKRMEDLLENKIDEYNGFYKKFEGYTMEDVDKIMINLTTMEQDVLALGFGLKGKKKITQQKIAQKYECSASYINTLIKKLILRIEDMLEKKENFENKNIEVDEKKTNDIKIPKEVETHITEMYEKIKKDYSSLINRYGKSKIDKIVLNLNKENQILLKTYFDFGNNKSLNIVSKLYVSSYQEILKNINDIMIEIKCLMEDFQNRRKEILSEIKNKKKLKLVNTILNLRELLLFDLYYGVNGRDMISIKEISRKFKMDEENVRLAIKEINSKINNYVPIKRK